MLVLSLLSPFYSVRDPSPWNTVAHVYDMATSLETPYSHAQRFVSRRLTV